MPQEAPRPAYNFRRSESAPGDRQSVCSSPPGPSENPAHMAGVVAVRRRSWEVLRRCLQARGTRRWGRAAEAGARARRREGARRRRPRSHGREQRQCLRSMSALEVERGCRNRQVQEWSRCRRQQGGRRWGRIRRLRRVGTQHHTGCAPREGRRSAGSLEGRGRSLQGTRQTGSQRARQQSRAGS